MVLGFGGVDIRWVRDRAFGGDGCEQQSGGGPFIVDPREPRKGCPLDRAARRIVQSISIALHDIHCFLDS